MTRDDITVVIADDHAVVRKGLRLLIDAEPGLRVVAEAGDVPGAVRLTRAHRPRVLVLDLNMPGGSSLEAIPTVAAGPTAVVVLTMQDDPSFARRALLGGASGFVLRRRPTTSSWRRSDGPPPETRTSTPAWAPGSRRSHCRPPRRRTTSRSARWRCCG